MHADLIPLLLRNVNYSNFEAGPFNLTRLQPYLNIAALSFTSVIVVILSRPKILICMCANVRPPDSVSIFPRWPENAQEQEFDT